MRKLAIVLIVATMLALAASGASGQVWCDPCNRVMLPIVHVSGAVR